MPQPQAVSSFHKLLPTWAILSISLCRGQSQACSCRSASRVHSHSSVRMLPGRTWVYTILLTVRRVLFSLDTTWPTAADTSVSSASFSKLLPFSLSFCNNLLMLHFIHPLVGKFTSNLLAFYPFDRCKLLIKILFSLPRWQTLQWCVNDVIPPCYKQKWNNLMTTFNSCKFLYLANFVHIG